MVKTGEVGMNLRMQNWRTSTNRKKCWRDEKPWAELGGVIRLDVISLDHSRISRSAVAPAAGSIKMIPQPSPRWKIWTLGNKNPVISRSSLVPAVSCNGINGGPRQSHGDRMRFQLPGHWGVARCCCFGMLLLVLFGSKGEMGRVSWANWNILNPFISNIIGWTTKKRISGLSITSVDLRGLFTVIGILPWLKKC